MKEQHERERGSLGWCKNVPAGRVRRRRKGARAQGRAHEGTSASEGRAAVRLGNDSLCMPTRACHAGRHSIRMATRSEGQACGWEGRRAGRKAGVRVRRQACGQGGRRAGEEAGMRAGRQVCGRGERCAGGERGAS
jgi:hypothetical protein